MRKIVWKRGKNSKTVYCHIFYRKKHTHTKKKHQLIIDKTLPIISHKPMDDSIYQLKALTLTFYQLNLNFNLSCIACDPDLATLTLWPWPLSDLPYIAEKAAGLGIDVSQTHFVVKLLPLSLPKLKVLLGARVNSWYLEVVGTIFLQV